MTTLGTLAASAGAGESLPAPTASVVIYGLLWLGLLSALLWLATRQHAQNRDLDRLQRQLQEKLDQQQPPASGD